MSIQVSYEGLYEKAVTFKNAAVSPAAGFGRSGEKRPQSAERSVWLHPYSAR